MPVLGSRKGLNRTQRMLRDRSDEGALGLAEAKLLRDNFSWPKVLLRFASPVVE